MKVKEILLMITVLVLDMLSKFWAQTNLVLYERNPIIPGFFNLTYAQNTGAAWSMLEGKMVFFYLVTLVAVIGLTIYLFRTDKKQKLQRFAIVLIIAGALGNFIDRLAFQYVRDFLDFVIFGYDFPIFNVADMSLCLGVFFLFVIAFWPEGEKKYGL